MKTPLHTRSSLLARALVPAALGLLSALSVGCAGGGLPGPRPQSASKSAWSPGNQGYGSPMSAAPSADASGGGYYQPRSDSMPAPAPTDERPGLATHWGESRSSFIRTTSFARADEERPTATAALWYNDLAGAAAMASYEGYRRYDSAAIGMLQGGISVSLRDEQGRLLPGYSSGGKTFAIGDSGGRYTIVVSNHTPARFEVVVTVDGLDVLDGHPGAFEKRGYLINPNASLEIEGFRQSESSVAAFRFGSVRGSYADHKDEAGNVGVIGVALFHERGMPVWPWDRGEVERRRGAEPFPGRFASPP